MDLPNGAEAMSADDNSGQAPPPTNSCAGVEDGEPKVSLLDKLLLYTAEVSSPQIFRKWAAIHAIGAAAERRVWTTLGINRLYPNLFVFLVGPPGVGKTQALEPVSVLLRKSTSVTISPNDMSKQGLLDALKEAQRGAMVEGRPFDYHFLAIIISELANFMSQYDHALAGLLTDLFDCRAANEEKKRGNPNAGIIPFPGISLICGTATENLGNTITNEMWGSGFMARVVMIYSSQVIVPEDMFNTNTWDERLAEEITAGLRRIGDFVGPVLWVKEAQLALREFRINQSKDAPVHNRLAHYVTRRWLHLGKLCMISALAHERMGVTMEDFTEAKSWLMEAEDLMPEIFKDMISHEDGQIYLDLRMLVWGETKSGRSKTVSAEFIYQYLSTRAGAFNVERLLQIAELGGYINRVAGTEGADAQYVAGRTNTKDAGIL